LLTFAPLLVEASPLAVPFPFGFLLGVDEPGALGDFLTPPLSPISA